MNLPYIYNRKKCSFGTEFIFGISSSTHGQDTICSTAGCWHAVPSLKSALRSTVVRVSCPADYRLPYTYSPRRRGPHSRRHGDQGSRPGGAQGRERRLIRRLDDCSHQRAPARARRWSGVIAPVASILTAWSSDATIGCRHGHTESRVQHHLGDVCGVLDKITRTAGASSTSALSGARRSWWPGRAGFVLPQLT